MFSGPEHALYIALMRELRLEREFENGDSFQRWVRPTSSFDDIVAVRQPPYWSSPEAWSGHDMDPDAASQDVVWLPRLDQWLTMLEAAGWCEVKLSPDAHLMDGRPVLWRVEGWGWDGRWSVNTKLEFTEFQTREEAVARLWCAVTGRKVASG